MSNKTMNVEDAIAQIPSGATIMVAGFGNPGSPFTLVNELLRQGQNNLTIIKNDANETDVGIDHLIANNRVTKYITSHIGLNRHLVEKMNADEIDVEFYPQGILAEKIRTGGGGSLGFVTDIGLDTEITNPEDLIEWQGQKVKIEPALNADYALIHADCADTMGNLIYNQSAINFSPLMAMAADYTIAESFKIVTPGELKPETIHTPCAFVDALVEITEPGDLYNLLEHHLE